MFYPPGKYAITTIQSLTETDQSLLLGKADWLAATFGSDYVDNEKGFIWIWGMNDEIRRFDIKEMKTSFCGSLVIVPIELVRNPYKGLVYTMSSWFQIEKIDKGIQFGHIFIKDITPVEIGF